MKQGWEIKKLGEVCDFKSGTTIASKLEKNEGEIIYAKVGDMNLPGNEEFITVSSRYVNINEINVNQIIPKGSIIFPKRGGAIATNKKRRIIRQTIVDLNTMALVPTKIIDKDYLFFWFQQIDLSDLSNGTSIPQINNYSFDNVFISFPKSLTEQQRIVAILNEAFASIAKAKANAEQSLKNAKELFESYLQSVFANKGEGWEEKNLGEVCEFVRGPFGGSLKKNIFKLHGYAIYEQQHAINNQFNDIRYFIDDNKFNEMKRFELNSGDLIMSCSGTMGKTAIVPKDIKKGIINQALLKLTPSKKLSVIFLKLWMQSENFQDRLKEYSQGAAIQNVASVKILKGIKIPLPTLISQESIVQNLNALSAETKKLESIYQQKLNDLEELKKSILQKAFNGELKTTKEVVV